jgi:hypothetical protein
VIVLTRSDPGQVDDLIRGALQGLCQNHMTHSIQNPSTIFAENDKEGTGTITFEEFQAGLKEGKVCGGQGARCGGARAGWALVGKSWARFRKREAGGRGGCGQGA